MTTADALVQVAEAIGMVAAAVTWLGGCVLVHALIRYLTGRR